MKNIFIIHSYNADTKEAFAPYISEKGAELGYNVILPDFPIRTEADFEKWSEIMDRYLLSGELNSESIIVAHSLGTQFIPKYIAQKNIPIKLYISVAAFIGYVGREDLMEIVAKFASTTEEVSKAIELMQNRYSIFSDNDHMNSQDKMEAYADSYQAEKILIPNAGHFNPQSERKELPEVFEIIEKTHNNAKNI
ncbi:alpha/beta hydrolase [Candidatus Saccharibacteria bacterium]|nr:alpha/beta hydrolase [Candidatus Saccharibacteria bacterium]